MRQETRYVHRGDLERRRARIRKWRMLLLYGSVGAVLFLLAGLQRKEANASANTFSFGFPGESGRLRNELEAMKGELQLANAQLLRANRQIHYSTKYKISADLAGLIYDVASAEGIEPDLAFRLVKVESQFNDRAKSPVGAVGLTQLMPATANYFENGITGARLYDRETNLRIGFRYLRALIREYDGDLKIALLVYNRGPTAVNNARALGLDPANGYDRRVAAGYRGKGVVD